MSNFDDYEYDWEDTRPDYDIHEENKVFKDNEGGSAPQPDVKYPDVIVTLVGEDGNAFDILGRVTKAMRRAQVPQADISAYMAEAMAGDYTNLLAVTQEWVIVE